MNVVWIWSSSAVKLCVCVCVMVAGDTVEISSLIGQKGLINFQQQQFYINVLVVSIATAQSPEPVQQTLHVRLTINGVCKPVVCVFLRRRLLFIVFGRSLLDVGAS